MNVTQFLARLSRGPLSNLSMSNDGDGTINVTRVDAIIDYLNEGLLKLYSKFILNEGEIILEQIENFTSYKLHSDYAVSTGGVAPLETYIKDTIDVPFGNDLIKILSVFRTGGCEVALNDATKEDSFYTPQFDVLQVPDPVAGAPLYILYQARHPEIVTGDDFGDQVIVLPAVLENALLSYVAFKVYFHMNGQENAASAGAHNSAYEADIALVEDKDLVNSSQSNTNTKFSQRGFV
jgi:hypothetical protein